MKGREITEILDYLQLKEASRRQTLKKNGIPSSTTASSGAGEKGKIPSKEDSPSSETCVQTSNDLSSLSKACRERGNASYKKGQFDEGQSRQIESEYILMGSCTRSLGGIQRGCPTRFVQSVTLFEYIRSLLRNRKIRCVYSMGVVSNFSH